MKNEIKVFCEDVFLNQVKPDTYKGYKVEAKEYVGKITNKSIMIEFGNVKKSIRIDIETLVNDGYFYIVTGFNCKRFNISNEDLEYLKKLRNMRKKVEEIKNYFTK